jgi:hypothetical protein
MVYYKLHTTFISLNVIWLRHDVTEKLLIFVLNNKYTLTSIIKKVDNFL